MFAAHGWLLHVHIFDASYFDRYTTIGCWLDPYDGDFEFYRCLLLSSVYHILFVDIRKSADFTIIFGHTLLP